MSSTARMITLSRSGLELPQREKRWDRGAAEPVGDGRLPAWNCRRQNARAGSRHSDSERSWGWCSGCWRRPGAASLSPLNGSDPPEDPTRTPWRNRLRLGVFLSGTGLELDPFERLVAYHPRQVAGLDHVHVSGGYDQFLAGVGLHAQRP